MGASGGWFFKNRLPTMVAWAMGMIKDQTDSRTETLNRLGATITGPRLILVPRKKRVGEIRLGSSRHRSRKAKNKRNNKEKATLIITPAKKLNREQRRMKASIYSNMLRKHPTPAESTMGSILESLRIKFVFQKVFFTRRGFFIIDFYLPVQKMVIEVDGLQHYTNKEKIKSDTSRTRYLEKVIGLEVIRLTNEEVLGEYDKVKAYFQRLFEPLGDELNLEATPTVELRTIP